MTKLQRRTLQVVLKKIKSMELHSPDDGKLLKTDSEAHAKWVEKAARNTKADRQAQSECIDWLDALIAEQE